MAKARDLCRTDGTAFTVRCSRAYKDWLERMVAEHTEGTVSHLVTKALKEYASRRGRQWEQPPPRM